METFKLYRKKDVTGVSGTGYIAEGWQTSYGEVILRWYGPHGGFGFHRSMEDCLAIHGHGGETIPEWTGGDGMKIRRS